MAIGADLGGNAVLAATNRQMQVQDRNQAALTNLQTRMDTRKTALEMTKLTRDFRTTVVKTVQDATFHSAKTSSQIAKSYGQVLKSV